MNAQEYVLKVQEILLHMERGQRNQCALAGELMRKVHAAGMSNSADPANIEAAVAAASNVMVTAGQSMHTLAALHTILEKHAPAMETLSGGSKTDPDDP